MLRSDEGKTGGADGGELKCIEVLVWKPDLRGHSEELSVEGRITKIDLKEVRWDDKNWTHLA
jgi:hypothetical protein